MSCRRARRPTRSSCSRSSPTRSRSPSRTRACTRASCGGRASLVESGRLLTGTLQVSEVLHRLSELVRTRLGADVVRILLHEDDAPGQFRLEGQAGSTRVAKDSTAHGDDGEGLVGWIMKHRTTLALTDVLARPELEYADWIKGRSEEHTSELQSRLHLGFR